MREALIVIDLQNDFLPDHVLGVPEADQIIPLINKLTKKFSFVVATRDYHPKDHVSFASSHHGKNVGEQVDDQVLWPEHCIAHTPGAELASALNKEQINLIFDKGSDQNVDSYSAFYNNARIRKTGLDQILRSKGIEKIYLCGVATDYCVLFSALDGIELGFDVTLIVDACRGIDLQPGSSKKAIEMMRSRGVKIITSDQIGI